VFDGDTDGFEIFDTRPKVRLVNDDAITAENLDKPSISAWNALEACTGVADLSDITIPINEKAVDRGQCGGALSRHRCPFIELMKES
jgi:hypothetical protein